MNHIRLTFFLSIFCIAQLLGKSSKEGIPEGGKVRPASITFAWSQRLLQGFDMRVWLSNQMTMGIQSWDVVSGDLIPEYPHFGLEYPTGSGIEHLAGAGPWIGGIVDNVPHVSEGYNGNDGSKEFSPDYSHLSRDHFWRTSIGTTAFDSLGYSGYYYLYNIPVNKRGIDDDGDGKVDEDDLDGLDNDGDWNQSLDDVGSDGMPDQVEASCNGTPYDPVTNPDPAYDNYDPTAYDSCHTDSLGQFPLKNNPDLYTEKNGIPDHGEPHVDEDYGAVSNSDLYCSATDTVSKIQENLPRHVPLGVQIIQKSYSWTGDVGKTILPFDYTFINVGGNTIRSTYIAFFADMDVGPVSVSRYPAHNLACYDNSTRTGYIYNPTDAGSTPLGVTILQTPKPLDSLQLIFQWFDYTTRPGPTLNDSDLYAWISGQPFGDSLIAQCQAQISDTRFFFSFGPFDQFKPGDTLRLSLGLVSGNSITDMLQNAARLHSFASNNFMLGVDADGMGIPTQVSLGQNYPNPFNPSTDIRYQIVDAGQVSLKVFDVLGREIATLVDGLKLPGEYTVRWDASRQSSGIYFYTLQVDKFRETKKMLLAR